MKTLIGLGITLLFLLLMAGCSTFHGAPEQSIDIEKDLKALETEYRTQALVKHYYRPEKPALDPKDKAKLRDEIITARMVLIDLHYLQWIRGLTSDKKAIDTAADMLILSLNIAGAAVGGATAKTVLAGLSAGVAGSKTAVDKHYYFEKTMPALVAAMNAERAAVRVKIVSGLAESIDAFPFEIALPLTYSYYEAGTLNGAIASISVAAAESQGKSDQQLEKLNAEVKSRIQGQLGNQQILRVLFSDSSRMKVGIESMRSQFEALSPEKRTLLGGVVLGESLAQRDRMQAGPLLDKMTTELDKVPDWSVAADVFNYLDNFADAEAVVVIAAFAMERFGFKIDGFPQKLPK